MTSIIQRYLILEIVKSSMATTLILFIILMSNTLGRVLSDVSKGDTPLQAVFPVLLGQSINVLTLLLPLGFFLGVVFALGRLYKDHELVVLQACGFGYVPLFRSVILVMLPLFLITGWCSLWLSADMLQRAIRIVDEEKNIHEFQQLKVGQFNESSNKKHVFYMQSMSEDRKEINDLIITSQGNGKQIIETAQRGQHKIDDKTGDLFLEVGPGTRYEGIAGDADYRIIEFDKHGILLKKKQAMVSELKSKEKYFGQIVNSETVSDQVELLWRISIPFTLVVLGLMAVPLSYIAPRQGRYGKIGLALLIFIVYLNLLGFSRSWLEAGRIPLWLNFWWVHVLFLLLALLLLKQRTRLDLFFWRKIDR